MAFKMSYEALALVRIPEIILWRRYRYGNTAPAVICRPFVRAALIELSAHTRAHAVTKNRSDKSSPRPRVGLSFSLSLSPSLHPHTHFTSLLRIYQFINCQTQEKVERRRIEELEVRVAGGREGCCHSRTRVSDLFT